MLWLSGWGFSDALYEFFGNSRCRRMQHTKQLQVKKLNEALTLLLNAQKLIKNTQSSLKKQLETAETRGQTSKFR